jgi:hypothetical protein
VKKFLLVLVALGVGAAIAYVVFSRARKSPERGAEPEIDLREIPSDEAAGSGPQIPDAVGRTIGSAN